MRKRMLALILAACMLTLSGCSDLNQVENLAIGVILGVDLNDQNEIELSLLVPRITGSQSEGGGSSGSKGELLYAASGRDFREALSLLQWAVPRRLDLSQLILIVFSERLAQSEQLVPAADAIMQTPRLYASARLAVCKGSARDFVEAEKPLVGTRISTELTATFEDYTRNGFIPDVTFSDAYYNLNSVYSDPICIYGEMDESGNSGEAKPASAVLPEQIQSSGIEMQGSNRFLGAAVFHSGRMAGRLSGEESMFCEILRGEQQSFPFSMDGQTFELSTLGKPDVDIDLSANPIQIHIRMRFSILPGGQRQDTAPIAQALEQTLTDTIETCRAMGAEPFRFAERAAGQFLTLGEWMNFDWNARFLESDVSVSVTLSSDET